MQLRDPGVVLFIFLIAVYGFSNALAVLKIGQFIFGLSHCPEKPCARPGHPKELRKGLGRIPYLGELFYCPPCLAFWFGLAVSRLVVSPSGFVIENAWAAMGMDGLMASGVIWLLHLIAERLGHNLPNL